VKAGLDVADAVRRVVRARVLENERMSGHTTLGVGGPADVFVEVETEDDLAALMGCISRAGLPWIVIGDGANLLVSDKGIRGVVISLAGEFEDVDVRPPIVQAGASARISAVADVAAENDLSGLEGVGTVPGTVGGAIVMNAGTHRGYIDEVTESVSVVTSTGEKRVLPREECGFTYRGSRFQTDQPMIVTGATFRLQPGDGAAIRRHLEQVRRHRAESQPQGMSAGCFFKNPESFRGAGGLIESAGGKGLREGRAVVSDIHANFIINEGGATAADLRNLAERVRDLVREKHGIELEYEVRMIGEW
jgi:UDP-N-acetylmuramate dehydrogenase